MKILFKDYNPTIHLGHTSQCKHHTILHCDKTIATRIWTRSCFHLQIPGCKFQRWEPSATALSFPDTTRRWHRRCMPFLLRAIKSSHACNIASCRPAAITSRATNQQSINKWMTCTNTSSRKLMKLNLSSTLWVIMQNLSSNQNHRLELLVEDAQQLRFYLKVEHDNSWCCCRTRRWYKIHPKTADPICSMRRALHRRFRTRTWSSDQTTKDTTTSIPNCWRAK